MQRMRFVALVGALFLGGGALLAQSGGGYGVEWQALGSAGEQFVAGSGYRVGFTLAQDTPPLAGRGAGYQVVQGYWAGLGVSPTAVVLAGFWIEARGEALVARWETAAELDTEGFHLYRSDTGPPGPYLRLNAELIPARGLGGLGGASYEWVDAGVQAGRVYTYLLEDVDRHGRATRHGPVSGALKTVRAYLPLVRR